MSGHAVVPQLLRLLEAENQALEEGDFARATSLLAEKTRLTRLLRDGSVQTGQDERDSRNALHRLSSAVRANAKLLERAIAVQRGMIAIVANAMRDVAPSCGYSTTGQSRRTDLMQPVAIRTTA